MNRNPTPADPDAIEPRLVWMAVFTAVIYGAISLLSWRFEFESPPAERPLLIVLTLFAACFAIYIVAIRSVVRQRSNRSLVRFIFLTAILFRLTLLFSVPIQEVDIYRYLWDGNVSCAGVSPFRFSPNQVLQHDRSLVESEASDFADPDLARLSSCVDSSPIAGEILSRVHFAQLPTVYPPVSQFVFAALTYVTPSDWRLLSRMILFKACFVVFDLVTLALVMLLLNRCRKHLGHSLIYAWCPLLMKEVANSGHLDAIAVCLTTAAVHLLLKERVAPFGAGFSLASFTLALAVGAKLYPVVLVPLFAITISRSVGWRGTVIPSLIFATTTTACLWQWIPGQHAHDDANKGIATFLQQWEINDFLFLNIIENVRPDAGRDRDELPWFTVLPESVKQKAVDFVGLRIMDANRAPFVLARLITLVIFSIIALSVAWRCKFSLDDSNDIHSFCRSVFLTIAWFWLLSPTQNPWYWTWTLPFLAFARGRVWLWVSGLVFLYYVRFWLGYHFADAVVLGTRYQGTRFFDYCVTWIEFGPWFATLFVDWWFSREQRQIPES